MSLGDLDTIELENSFKEWYKIEEKVEKKTGKKKKRFMALKKIVNEKCTSLGLAKCTETLVIAHINAQGEAKFNNYLDSEIFLNQKPVPKQCDRTKDQNKLLSVRKTSLNAARNYIDNLFRKIKITTAYSSNNLEVRSRMSL